MKPSNMSKMAWATTTAPSAPLSGTTTSPSPSPTVTPSASPSTTTGTTYQRTESVRTPDRSSNWGALGLLGLIGLANLFRKPDEKVIYEEREPDEATRPGSRF
jgi:hypothetical protein